MASVDIYVEVEINHIGYVRIMNKFLTDDVDDYYNQYVLDSKKYGHSKYESKEGYLLRFLNLSVHYDGRKRSIDDNDILRALANEGYAVFVTDSMICDLYRKTDKLVKVLELALHRRKVLANLIKS